MAIAGSRKEMGGPPPSQLSIQKVIESIKRSGLDLKSFEINLQAYNKYVRDTQELYRNYDYPNFVEKSLEHFVAAQLLELKSDDVYIDVASDKSPTPEIYHKLYGSTTYRQDIQYPEGICGNVIGGDAAKMPLEDGFATKMALHCSFEHFENDTDIRFIKEAYRILRNGGRLCILPLYISTKYAIQTDPAVFTRRNIPSFENDATIYCKRGWGNRHGRFYDIPHFLTRIVNNKGSLALTVYDIENVLELNQSCYLKFAAVFDKRA